MPEGRTRTRIKGTVMHAKAAKTVVVTVERRVRHPLYKKYITRSRRYQAHDEKNRCKVGDLVEIVSSRPLSKTKRWAVAKVLKRADTSLAPDSEEQEAEQEVVT
jgi:small subunit ribosomal protein S17